MIPSFVDEDRLYYKEKCPELFPDHVSDNNNLFLQMLNNLKAHIVMVCEAGTLVPHREYLESEGWTLCFNDAQDLCCRLFSLQDHKRIHKKTFGEVQIEKCHLQSLRVHGERQFQEAPMKHPQEVILIGAMRQILRK